MSILISRSLSAEESDLNDLDRQVYPPGTVLVQCMKNKETNTMRKIVKFLLFTLLALCFSVNVYARTPITSKEELNQPDMKVGVMTGTAAMFSMEKQLPEAEEVFMDSLPTAIESVKQGKIDAMVYDRMQLEYAIKSGAAGVHLLDENLDEGVPIAVGISPVTSIPDFTKKLNTFISETKANGVLDDMYKRWVILKEEKMPDIEPAKDPKYHLVVGTTGMAPPYSFFMGETIYGYDIELAYRFAAWLGADVTFKIYDYGSIINAAKSGDVDCIMANLNVTFERKESIDFSDELYHENIGILVSDGEQSKEDGEKSLSVFNGKRTGNGFLSSIADSFNKTFIRESRWKMFVMGVINTLIITVFSILFGTALGFAVFYVCRGGNVFANTITKFMLWLVQGMPVVVLLMILYYIMFAKASISGISVAVIGFTLIFAAAVFGLLKIGVGAVDNGQYEAAYALGHSYRDTFFKIILPQALPHVLPAYRGEIVGLIKATSVVGYIAVQDLTKMGDIVRSRTYEAFFPLIAITVIYFVLEWLIGIIVSHMELKYNPKQRTKEQILKGVKEND